MRIAVAGGFGFLGSMIVKKLEGMGYDVIPFSRQTNVDIKDYLCVKEYLEKIRPEIVINSAAHVGGIAYNSIKPIKIYEDNLMIGFNLIKSCQAVGVKKFVNIMPNCTYPDTTEMFMEEKWWDGEMHPSVLTYGMPRKALWVQCWAYLQRYNFKSIHLVLPNLYGPGDHFDEIRSHAVGALIRKIVDAKKLNEKSVVVWGTGKPIREWGYVEDAAEGIVRALDMYNDMEIMNIGEGKGYSIREIAILIKNIVNWEGVLKFDVSYPDGAPKKVLNSDKMKKVLNWQPKTSINDGLASTIEWYLESKNRSF